MPPIRSSLQIAALAPSLHHHHNNNDAKNYSDNCPSRTSHADDDFIKKNYLCHKRLFSSQKLGEYYQNEQDLKNLKAFTEQLPFQHLLRYAPFVTATTGGNDMEFLTKLETQHNNRKNNNNFFSGTSSPTSNLNDVIKPHQHQFKEQHLTMECTEVTVAEGNKRPDSPSSLLEFSQFKRLTDKDDKSADRLTSSSSTTLIRNRNIKNQKLVAGPPYSCQQCSAIFSQRDHLDKHKMMHPSKSNNCKICHKHFANVYRLQRHMISHDESSFLRKFKCTDCDKAFKFKHHLKEHLRIHSGEKPFGCDNCGKRFSHSGSYSGHMTSKKCISLKLNNNRSIIKSLENRQNPKPNINSNRNLISDATPPSPTNLFNFSPPGIARLPSKYPNTGDLTATASCVNPMLPQYNDYGTSLFALLQNHFLSIMAGLHPYTIHRILELCAGAAAAATYTRIHLNQHQNQNKLNTNDMAEERNEEEAKLEMDLNENDEPNNVEVDDTDAEDIMKSINKKVFNSVQLSNSTLINYYNNHINNDSLLKKKFYEIYKYVIVCNKQ